MSTKSGFIPIAFAQSHVNWLYLFGTDIRNGECADAIFFFFFCESENKSLRELCVIQFVKATAFLRDFQLNLLLSSKNK